ncbi:MAG: hypothetical protein HZC36_05295 [Armatimonadetes bacterium]|nr:hypothetical protein [Armatimonadota bacterium]
MLTGTDVDPGEIVIEYGRLSVHVQRAIADVDEAAFRDMAACLRNWWEMRKAVDSLCEQYGIILTFDELLTSGDKVKQLAQRNPYHQLLLPCPPGGLNVTIGAMFQIAGPISDQADAAAMYKAGPPQTRRRRMKFVEWLGCRIYVFGNQRRRDGRNMDISRGVLIQRTANVFGGSHPRKRPNEKAKKNRFDRYVRLMHRQQVAGGYPMTYYILLATAQEIGRTLRPLVDSLNSRALA